MHYCWHVNYFWRRKRRRGLGTNRGAQRGRPWGVHNFWLKLSGGGAETDRRWCAVVSVACWVCHLVYCLHAREIYVCACVYVCICVSMEIDRRWCSLVSVMSHHQTYYVMSHHQTYYVMSHHHTYYVISYFLLCFFVSSSMITLIAYDCVLFNSTLAACCTLLRVVHISHVPFILVMYPSY